MKRYAANRVCIASNWTILRNGVVELDEASHVVARTFQLDEEIRQTEWKGGLILICKEPPHLTEGEDFKSFMERIHREEEKTEKQLLYAFHVTAFNVSDMQFTPASRIVSL